jgi:hypothetical protein
LVDNSSNLNHPRGRINYRWLIAGALVFVLLWLIPLFFAKPVSTTPDPVKNADGDLPVASPAVSVILASPANYYGRPVSISGQIKQVIDQRSFVIASGNEEILVIGQRSVPELSGNQAGFTINNGDSIKATGVVRMFEANEIKKEISGVNTDSLGNWNGKPVILANNLGKNT